MHSLADTRRLGSSFFRASDSLATPGFLLSLSLSFSLSLRRRSLPLKRLIKPRNFASHPAVARSLRRYLSDTSLIPRRYNHELIFLRSAKKLPLYEECSERFVYSFVCACARAYRLNEIIVFQSRLLCTKYHAQAASPLPPRTQGSLLSPPLYFPSVQASQCLPARGDLNYNICIPFSFSHPRVISRRETFPSE